MITTPAAPAAPRTLRQRAMLGGLLLLALAGVVVHYHYPTNGVGDLTFLVLGAGAAVAAWVGAQRAPHGARLVPALIAMGLTASALGDLSYRIYQWAGSAPDISLADIPWFSSYACLGAALVILLIRAQGQKRVDVDAVIDALTVVTVSVLILWHFSISAMMSDTTATPLVRMVWAGYPVADAALLALVVRALSGRRSRAALGFGFAAGVACWLGADLGFLLFTTSEGFSAWLDVGWVVGAILMASAAWRWPAPAAADLDTIRTDARTGMGRVAIAILPLGVPPLLEFIADRGGEDSADSLAVFVGMGALLALGFWRTARMLGSERRAKAEAGQSHRHYARLSANSSDAVAVVDVNGCLLGDPTQLAALAGFVGPTLGRDVFALLAPVDPDELLAHLARVAATPGEVLSTEMRIRQHPNGPLWLGARMVNLLEDADVNGIVLSLHDISVRKQFEADLSHQAFHDALTGLPNRALFLDRAEHALHRTARTGLEPAVLYIDLDGFKNVNDSLGHDAGDEMLRLVAARLLTTVRSDETVARLGGDEFAILIEASAAPMVEAAALADRVLQVLTSPFVLEGAPCTMSASIGIAGREGDSMADSMVRNADIAMYRAKINGKAQWVLYEPLMRAAALERLQVETDLRLGLEGDQFRLVYQPVVEVETARVVGFEALLRWHHPTLGLVMPDRFIPLAEETGAIVPIGQWVLRTACFMAVEWQAAYPRDQALTMAVNLSARQLADDDIVAQVADALEHSGLDPTTLVLEMTESALVHDAAVAAKRLHELKALGVRVAIDDFGTGYSSLSYLRQFPIDILKIDRSFINTITERTKLPAIVRGLLDLARTLGLETVAEGVEDEVQRQSLRDAQCELAQGYLFSRPLEQLDADAFLAQTALLAATP